MQWDRTDYFLLTLPNVELEILRQMDFRGLITDFLYVTSETKCETFRKCYIDGVNKDLQ